MGLREEYVLEMHNKDKKIFAYCASIVLYCAHMVYENHAILSIETRKKCRKQGLSEESTK